MSEEEKCSKEFQSPFHFFPPLAMQRCSFCLAILKRLRVQTVLELGCGEGTLLGLLTNAAIALGEFPSSSDLQFLEKRLNEVEDPIKKGRLQTIEKIIQRTPELDVYQRDLHLQLLIGLDLEQDKLERLHELIKQGNSKYDSDIYHSSTRWEPLKVELWCGDLAVHNQRFVGVECVVMSEVIEHLFPEQFDQSIPLLFSKYQPQWIVITTPNYEFNEHIDQYSSHESRSQHRFLDPTGRTNRHFRDSDHKFEWTQDEFKEWCDSISSNYDYDYEITGCGSYNNYFKQSLTSTDIKVPKPRVPIPEFPEKFFATQIVVFERRTKISKPTNLDCENDNNKSQHRLIGVEDYIADELSDKASTPKEILQSVKGYLLATQQSRVQLRELWLCNSGLDKLCGGKLVQLLIAFSDEDEWELEVEEKKKKENGDLNPHSITGMDAISVTWIKFLTYFQNQPKTSKNRDSHWMNSWK